jgi:hypothetical protein
VVWFGRLNSPGASAQYATRFGGFFMPIERRQERMTDYIEPDHLTPQFLSEEEEKLFAQVMLKEEAIKFLNSDLGRVLMGFAEQERREAAEALLTTSPWRKRRIQQLQFKAAVAGSFRGWVREVIAMGDVAHQNLLQMRD